MKGQSSKDMKLERMAALGPEQFVSDYLAASTPVVVTDAMDGWDMSRFSASSLGAEFGECLVPVYDDLFSIQYLESLKDYLDDCFGCSEKSERCDRYVRWYAQFRDIEFSWADDAFDTLRSAWRLPSFFPRDAYLLPYCPVGRQVDQDTRFPFQGMFISGRGARTNLHIDPLCSSALLCQLEGIKRMKLYRPGSDPAMPPAFEDTLNVGEIVLFPRGWAHEVESLTDSVSLTWNFVHASEARALVASLDAKAEVDHLDTLRYFVASEAGTQQELAGIVASRFAALHVAA
jgi:hypothetical protein